MPIFITEKWIEVHDQSGNADNRYTPKKQIMLKTSMLRSDLCDFSNAYIIVNGTITVEGRSNNSNKKKKRFLAFKNMHHLIVAFQKLCSLIMQKT